jgi:hypothetical protein
VHEIFVVVVLRGWLRLVKKERMLFSKVVGESVSGRQRRILAMLPITNLDACADVGQLNIVM